jgi:hypothetical protein
MALNGYFISITNNLLEGKHYEQMGQAVWLYMWLIDRMTDISEGQGIVNNGVPISYEMVHENLETLTHRTYMRMMATLRDAGYINTMQAKYGTYVTINKAKKHFGKRAETTPVKKPSRAKNGTAETKTPQLRQKRQPAVPNMSSSYAKNGVSLYIDNNTNNKNKTLAKAKAQAPEKYGNQEINDAFEYWETTIGYAITGKRDANRRAAHNLIKKYQLPGLKQLVDGVKLANDDRYAPRISDFAGLQAKLNDLLLWGHKRNNGKSGTKRSISV